MSFVPPEWHEFPYGNRRQTTSHAKGMVVFMKDIIEISDSHPHGILTVRDRQSVTLDGVKNVEGFDEGYVSLATNSGKVIIEGKGLKIESLTRDDGVIFISGRINGVYYSEEKPERGFFSNLFK